MRAAGAVGGGADGRAGVGNGRSGGLSASDGDPGREPAAGHRLLRGRALPPLEAQPGAGRCLHPSRQVRRVQGLLYPGPGS